MPDSFAQILRFCRKKAGLSQKELAIKINVHDSVISRLENDKIPPNIDRIQDIISVLALNDVPQELLDHLWERAGFHLGQNNGSTTAPIISYLQQVFLSLTPEQKKNLSAKLGSITEIYQAQFKAEEMMAQGKWGDAVNTSDRGMALFDQIAQELQANSAELQGYCLYRIGRYGEAIAHFESALLSVVQQKDKVKEADLLIKSGNSYRRLGGQGWETAASRYKAAHSVLLNLGIDIQVADCLRRLAVIDLYKGRPDLAHPLVQESLDLCRKIGHEGIVYYKGLQHLGWVYDLLGRWSEATNLLEEANNSTFA